MNAAEPFEAIVREHYEPLFRFAMSLTQTESDACDLTQQTFYIWATKGQQLRDRSKVKTWLFTTLHRAFLAARRRHTRFPHHPLEEASEQLPSVAPNVGGQFDAAQVLSALARVDKVYRAAVALFYLDDCPYKEIAAALDVPVGTVKSRIARGIAQLREILLSEGSLDSPLSRSGNASIPSKIKPSPAEDTPASPRPTFTEEGFRNPAQI